MWEAGKHERSCDFLLCAFLNNDRLIDDCGEFINAFCFLECGFVDVVS